MIIFYKNSLNKQSIKGREITTRTQVESSLLWIVVYRHWWCIQAVLSETVLTVLKQPCHGSKISIMKIWLKLINPINYLSPTKNKCIDIVWSLTDVYNLHKIIKEYHAITLFRVSQFALWYKAQVMFIYQFTISLWLILSWKF